jgi:signal recognition particle subunit SRP72
MGPKAAPAPSKQNTRPKPKSPPKPPLSVPDQLKRLFTSLCAQIDGGHFKNAIRTCDKSASVLVIFRLSFHSLYIQVLRLEPTDKDALQTKLFLLLQTEQYSAALTLADSAEHGFEFGRAYSLYRLHREHEAAAGLNEIKATVGLSRGVNHLEAQLVCITAPPSLVHIFFISGLHFTEL